MGKYAFGAPEHDWSRSFDREALSSESVIGKRFNYACSHCSLLTNSVGRTCIRIGCKMSIRSRVQRAHRFAASRKPLRSKDSQERQYCDGKVGSAETSGPHRQCKREQTCECW